MAIAGQLFLATLVINQYLIETVALRRVLYVACAGYVVNFFLPACLRLPFFLCISLVAGTTVLSPGFDAAALVVAVVRLATLIAAGIVLIAICHRAIKFWYRTLLLAGVAVVVGLMHAGYIGPESLRIVWSLLAALFVFRIIIYHYVVSTDPEAAITYSIALLFLFAAEYGMQFSPL